MTDGKLSPKRTALLFFDMLNGHVKIDEKNTKSQYIPVIKNAINLLEMARGNDMMVVYACANHRFDYATSASTIRDTNNRLQQIDSNKATRDKPPIIGGTWGAEVIEEIKPGPEDYMVFKYRWNAFYQTSLELFLKTRGIDTIIIAGGSTDVGVASTAYSARDRDYNVVIASDACTSKEQDNHDQFMRRIFPRMSRVRSTREIVELLTPH
ncbi:cysteine hydrolase [Halalkalibacter okhensis]|uniref:Isochorismatase n=1 Tax=Halalkalibacter okhensis TaxID=333138 RepID=A0A0B0I803_9BACI|nr:cysteine hydrolase [Halalkalibacter okhensis]KHF38628.1 isochorismatase [Halalkalibacter okhensis]